MGLTPKVSPDEAKETEIDMKQLSWGHPSGPQAAEEGGGGKLNRKRVNTALTFLQSVSRIWASQIS